MKTNVKLLAQICEVAGAPGYEQRVREIVLKNIKGIADKIEQDNLGNIYAIKKGKDSSKRVMIAAHMDEIGFMVKHIDENGFLRFHTLGGFDPKTLTSQRVIVHGKKDLIGVMGSKPIHIMTAEEKSKCVQISDFFIDLGLPYKEVVKYVSIGDVITRDRHLIEMGDCVNCKSIDNRVAVYILIETLKLLKDCPYDVYGVFSVQEEVGIRGANVAAHNINPSFGFGLDTTIAYDLPDSKPEEQVTKLGGGVAGRHAGAAGACRQSAKLAAGGLLHPRRPDRHAAHRAGQPVPQPLGVGCGRLRATASQRQSAGAGQFHLQPAHARAVLRCRVGALLQPLPGL